MMAEDADGVVDDFANRLRFEFEDRMSLGGDDDEDQDWFVNDERTPSPVKSDLGVRLESAASSPVKSPGKADADSSTSKPLARPTPLVKKSNSAPTVDSNTSDDDVYSSCETSFLHYFPPVMGILVMEVCQSDLMTEKRYGAKYFKFYLPQVHDAQTEFCLYARKRLNKSKYRFSLSEDSMPKWTSNPYYEGKVAMTTAGQSRKFKLAVPKNAARVHFDIDQETRKQELVVRLNAQSKGFSLFRARAASDEATTEFRSLIQKFINPIADVRCSKTNDTLLKMEKEGEAGYEKYIITYARPFSLFVTCCIAVSIEGHLID